MRSTRFEIERVPPDIDPEVFHRRYFEPERPVIVGGIGPRIQRIDELTIGNIREKIVEKGLATVNTSWFEGPAEMLGLLAATPGIVARELADSHCRENHCRLWLNGAGNVTPSHYDGNLLYVFNLQFKGCKEWRIVSPHTPLRNYPFSRGALRGTGWGSPPPRERVEFCDFVLEEGDMIFLPPLWHHMVKATAEENINVNWVATRKSGHVGSKTLQRERELLKFALLCYGFNGRTEMLNLMLGAGIKGYLENFAGVGWDFIEEQTAAVPTRLVVTRFLREMALAGYALKDLKKLRRQLKRRPLDSVTGDPAVASGAH